MTGRPAYTEYHPRWLRPRMSVYWWLGRWPYVRFILRELSSLAVAWFVLYLLVLFRAVGVGEVIRVVRVRAGAQPPVVLEQAADPELVGFGPPRELVGRRGRRQEAGPQLVSPCRIFSSPPATCNSIIPTLASIRSLSTLVKPVRAETSL